MKINGFIFNLILNIMIKSILSFVFLGIVLTSCNCSK
ncbi:META domain-containing protein, partial [Flavobacterium tructae]